MQAEEASAGPLCVLPWHQQVAIVPQWREPADKEVAGLGFSASHFAPVCRIAFHTQVGTVDTPCFLSR